MAVAVLYVTGWCRSGSTVLGNVLAKMPGVFHDGELRFLWQTDAQLIVDSSNYASDAALLQHLDGIEPAYVHLVRDPRGSVARVLALVGRGAEDNPVTEDGHAELGPNHTVTGNPNRFERGRVSLREDRRWHDSLPAPRRAAATALAWPLIGRYDYSRKP
jgi:hypothetical protein